VLKGSQAMLCALDKSFILEIAFVQENGQEQLDLAVARHLLDCMPSKQKAVTLSQCLKRVTELKDSKMVQFTALSVQSKLEVCKSVLQKMLKGIPPHLNLKDDKGFFGDFFTHLEFFARARRGEGKSSVELCGKPAVEASVSALKATLAQEKRSPAMGELDSIMCFEYLLGPADKAQLQTWQADALANVARGVATSAKTCGDEGTSKSARAQSGKTTVLSFFG
jgi:molybdopterin converting factor small subunit